MPVTRTRSRTGATAARDRSRSPVVRRRASRSRTQAPVETGDAPSTPTSLASLTVRELRALLSGKGLPYSGLRKAELIQALVGSAAPSSVKRSRTPAKKTPAKKASPSPRAQQRGRSPTRKARTPQSKAASPSRSRSRSRKAASRSPSRGAVSRVYSTGENTNNVASLKAELHHVRENMNLLHHPLLVLNTLIHVLYQWFVSALALMVRNRGLLALFTLVFVGLFSLYHTEGDHQDMVSIIEDNIVFIGEWVGLGILSSVGLGTGLHTFVLYLGPHIFNVAFAGYECGRLDFPVVGPDAYACPTKGVAIPVTFFAIVQKVQWEALLWGLGTAIGELPPYFIARAARLSGKKLQELEEEEDIDESTLTGRVKKYVLEHMAKMNFFSIMLLASVPNPLFDLAGLTCGHLLVPFWTFFGATVIGKAVNKAHIQVFFVIAMASNQVVSRATALAAMVHPALGKFVTNTIAAQKKQLHRKPGSAVTMAEKTLFATIWDWVLILCISLFVISIITSLVRGELVARAERKIEEAEENAKSRRAAKRSA